MHFLLVFLGIAFSTSAYPQSASDLIESATRPTMSDIKRLYEQSRVNPFNSLYSYRINSLKTPGLPEAIAMFERSFPGATFYELGRDAVFLGDAIDAFYLAIGQTDRVKRLDASAPSFNIKDKALINEFLRSNGISTNEEGEPWPQVIFDTTSFSAQNGIGISGGGASQSVQLIQAGYEAFTNAGGDPTTLLRRFNFISVGGAWKNWPDMRSQGFIPEKVFAKQAETISAKGFREPFFCPMNEFTYGATWHEPFGRFQKQPDGTVTAIFERPRDAHTHESILWEMFEVYKIMSSPTTLKRVQKAASERSFVFPLTRTAEIELIPVASAKGKRPGKKGCENTLE